MLNNSFMIIAQMSREKYSPENGTTLVINQYKKDENTQGMRGRRGNGTTRPMSSARKDV